MVFTVSVIGWGWAASQRFAQSQRFLKASPRHTGSGDSRRDEGHSAHAPFESIQELGEGEANGGRCATRQVSFLMERSNKIVRPLHEPSILIFLSPLSSDGAAALGSEMAATAVDN